MQMQKMSFVYVNIEMSMKNGDYISSFSKHNVEELNLVHFWLSFPWKWLLYTYWDTEKYQGHIIRSSSSPGQTISFTNWQLHILYISQKRKWYFKQFSHYFGSKFIISNTEECRTVYCSWSLDKIAPK